MAIFRQGCGESLGVHRRDTPLDQVLGHLGQEAAGLRQAGTRLQLPAAPSADHTARTWRDTAHSQQSTHVGIHFEGGILCITSTTQDTAPTTSAPFCSELESSGKMDVEMEKQ